MAVTPDPLLPVFRLTSIEGRKVTPALWVEMQVERSLTNRELTSNPIGPRTCIGKAIETCLADDRSSPWPMSDIELASDPGLESAAYGSI